MPIALHKIKLLILLSVAVRSFFDMLTFPVNTPADLAGLRARGVPHLLRVTGCAWTVRGRDTHGDSQGKAVPAVCSSLFSCVIFCSWLQSRAQAQGGAQESCLRGATLFAICFLALSSQKDRVEFSNLILTQGS